MAEGARYKVIGSEAMGVIVNTAEQVGEGGIPGVATQPGDWLVTNGRAAQVLTDVQFRERYVHEDGSPLPPGPEPEPLNRRMDPVPSSAQYGTSLPHIETPMHGQPPPAHGVPPHVQHPGGAPMVAGGPPPGGPQPHQTQAQGAPVQHQPGVHPPPTTGPTPPTTGRR